MHIWHPDLPRNPFHPGDPRPVPISREVVYQLNAGHLLAGLCWLESYRLSEDALREVAFISLGLIPEDALSAPIYSRVRRLVEWNESRRDESQAEREAWFRRDAAEFSREWAEFATERGLSRLQLDVSLRTTPAVLSMRHLFRALGLSRGEDQLSVRERLLLSIGLAVAALDNSTAQHPPPDPRNVTGQLLERWAGHVMARLAVRDPQAFGHASTVGGRKGCPLDFPDEVDEHYGVEPEPHKDISREAGAFIKEARGLLDVLGVSGLRLVFGVIDSPPEKGSVGDLCHYLDGTMPCPVIVCDTKRMHEYIRRFRLPVREAVWITLAHECGHGWLDAQRVSSSQTSRVPLALEERAVEAMAQEWWATRDAAKALTTLKRELLAGVRKPAR